VDNKRNQPDIYRNRYPDNRNGGNNLPAEVYHNDEINLADSTQIRDYLDIILRRKWIIILSVLFCIITVAISTLLTKPLFMATAVIEIIPNPPRITSFAKEAESTYSVWDTEEFYETHYKLLKSQSFAKHVINKLGMVPKADLKIIEQQENKQSFFAFIKSSIYKIIGIGSVQDESKEVFDPIKESEERKNLENSIAAGFIEGVSITPDRKSRLTYVNYVSTDPGYASKSINTIVDEYTRWTVARKHSATKVAREFLEIQLDNTKASLENSEEELAKFAKSVNVVSLDKDLNLVYKQLEEINQAYASSETERLSKQALYIEIENGNYDYLPQVIQDEALQELLVVRTNLNSEYLNKGVIYGPNYPEMKQLKAQLGAVTAAIEKKENRCRGKFKKRLQGRGKQGKAFKRKGRRAECKGWDS